MKINKLAAVIIAGVITCTAPAGVYAADINAESIAEEIVENDKVNELATDPDKVADIIISVKNMIDSQNITDDQISSGVDMAAEQLGVSLSESEKKAIVTLASKFVNMNISDEEIRNGVNDVYNTLESLGIGKEEVKGILKKAINVVKNLMN